MINKEQAIINIRENYKNVFPPPVLDLLIYLIGGGLADSDQPGETFIFQDSFDGSFKTGDENDPSQFQSIWNYPIPKDGYLLMYVESQIYSEFNNAEESGKPSKSLSTIAQQNVYMYDGDQETILSNSDLLKSITLATSSTPFQFSISQVDGQIKVQLWDISTLTQEDLKTQWKIKINVLNVPTAII